MFHQTGVTLGDTTCNVNGVLSGQNMGNTIWQNDIEHSSSDYIVKHYAFRQVGYHFSLPVGVCLFVCKATKILHGFTLCFM